MEKELVKNFRAATFAKRQGFSVFVKYAIALYLFAIFFCYSSGDTIVRVARVVVFGVGAAYAFTRILLHNVIRGEKVKSNYYYFWCFIVILYFAMQITWGYVIDAEASKRFLLSTLYSLIVNVIVLYYLVNNPEQFLFFVKFICFVAPLSLLRVYLTYGFDSFFESRQVEDLNANGYALRAVIGMLFSLHVIFTDEKLRTAKLIYWGLALVNLVLMALAASRKSYVLILVTLVTYLLFTGKSFLKSVRNLLIIVAILVGVYFALTKISFLYDIIGSRIESMIMGFLGQDTDSSTSTRLKLIERGIMYFKEHPVWGYGLDGFRTLERVSATASNTYYAHNNFIEILVAGGIVGFIVYYSLFFVMLFGGIFSIEKKDKTLSFFFGLFLALLISEYGMVTYYEPQIQFVYTLCFFVLRLKNRKNKRSLIFGGGGI